MLTVTLFRGKYKTIDMGYRVRRYMFENHPTISTVFEDGFEEEYKKCFMVASQRVKKDQYKVTHDYKSGSGVVALTLFTS